MGQAVGVGALWTASFAVAARLASLGAQWVLGLVLLDADFGLFAIAASLAGGVQVLRDAGARYILMHRPSEFETLAGPVFFLALALNLVCCLILLAVAPVAAGVYGSSTLGWMVAIIALSIPPGTPAAVLGARMSIDLRFREWSAIQLRVAMLRYATSVGFALAGLGALSFVLPLPLVAAYESLATWRATRSRPWRASPQVRHWGVLLRQAAWVMASGGVNTLFVFGDYMVAGLFVSERIVGLYFFAYQMVHQVGMLLWPNISAVLLPALAHLAGEPERHRAAVVRALRVTMLAGCAGSLVTIPVFGPLESLIWHGKWAPALEPVQILAVCFPFLLGFNVGMATLMAGGQFRHATLLTAGLAILRLAVVASAARVAGTAEGLTAAVAVAVILCCTAFVLAVLVRLGVSVRTTLESLLAAWLVSLLAAGLALLADAWCFPPEASAGTGREVLRLGMGVMVFGVVLAGGTRVCLPGHLHEALGILPRRLARPVRALLRLPEREA